MSEKNYNALNQIIDLSEVDTDKRKSHKNKSKKC